MRNFSLDKFYAAGSTISNRRLFIACKLLIVCALNLTSLFINQWQAIEAAAISSLSNSEVLSAVSYRPQTARKSSDNGINHRPQAQQPQQTVYSSQQMKVSSSSSSTTTTSTTANNNNPETSALNYLQKYGYMNSANLETNNLISEDSFSAAISQFQRFAGLPETGLVDNQTLRLMQIPRCGNSDYQQTIGTSHTRLAANRQSAAIRKRALFIEFNPSAMEDTTQQRRQRRRKKRRRRRKRYALQGSKWRRQELTYRISQYPTRFAGKRHEVDAQIEKAFGVWSQVAPIDFVVKKEGRVHIDIRFASGDHGDGDSFDGPGNTLAHAYFPQYGGDAHFDDQEYWTIDSYTGTNIFQVAAHELGHSLGLGHSNVREALMAPFYQKYKPNFKLHVDDVLAIQALYGEKPYLSSSSDELPPLVRTTFNSRLNPTSSVPTPTPTTTTTTTASPSTTTTTTTTTTIRPPSSTSNTTTSSKHFPDPTFNRRTFAPPFFGGGFKPDTTVRETNDVDDDNQVTSNHLPDFGGNGNGGNSIGQDEVGVASGSGSDIRPPVDLCLESTIDAITRTEDGSSYVFKGDFYWLLTSEGLAKGYPRKISTNWDGLPGSLDAALTWADGKTFFFKGNKYWRFRNQRRDVGYPKLISAGFAGIPDNIDAAFVWSGNGRTYIFKGTEYWRFDSKAEPPVSSEYPRSIKVWNGVPSYVNAAFKWANNITYFFKANQYYRFNDKEFKVESRGRPPFPRSSAEWWFGCDNSNLANQRATPGGGSSLLSSLREQQQHSVDSLNRQQQQQQNFQHQHQHDNDWSYFAGSDANMDRRLGTHISDHKPVQGTSTFDYNNDNNDNSTSIEVTKPSFDMETTNSSTNYHHLIGLPSSLQPPLSSTVATITTSGATNKNVPPHHRINNFHNFLAQSTNKVSSSAISSLAQQQQKQQYLFNNLEPQINLQLLLSLLSSILMMAIQKRHSYYLIIN